MQGVQILGVVSTTCSKRNGNNGSTAGYTKIKIGSCSMTSPQGMDELFWGRDHEDVNDWA